MLSMEAFLGALFGEAVCEARRVSVFTLPDRRTRHFSSMKAAALHTAKEAQEKDVYFGAGLAGANFGKRNCAKDVVAIVGLWADIDLTAPWRPHKPLPRTVDEARAIIEKLPFPPSLIVDSGHGLQPWWVFKEPWTFDSDEERLQAAKTAKGWVETVRGAAQSLGFEVDSVGDLARIPPGRFKVVILDAFYRFLPMRADENDNGTMTGLKSSAASESRPRGAPRRWPALPAGCGRAARTTRRRQSDTEWQRSPR